ncbi:uncharacterized protein LY79DRAFT_569635, partial [Colletotrichum navitas]
MPIQFYFCFPGNVAADAWRVQAWLLNMVGKDIMAPTCGQDRLVSFQLTAYWSL